MRRRLIHQWCRSTFKLSSYPVLAIVSNRCPRLMGRSPTCYSPVRRSQGNRSSLSSLDSHSLSTPLACVLSQDQTLQRKCRSVTRSFAQPSVSHHELITSYAGLSNLGLDEAGVHLTRALLSFQGSAPRQGLQRLPSNVGRQGISIASRFLNVKHFFAGGERFFSDLPAPTPSASQDKP